MTTPGSRFQPAVEEYVSAIETHLRARRGVEHILSPRDFALARAWYEAGVPLATVLVGMDRAFEQSANVSSLTYCRRRVEELAAAGPRPEIRPAPPVETIPLSEVESLLASLLDQLEKVRPARGLSFEPPLRKIREVQDLLAVAARPNWEYVRSKLREIDDEVSVAALEALPAETAATVKAESERAAERHRTRVDAASLEDAVLRLRRQRAREFLRLPRVSLV